MREAERQMVKSVCPNEGREKKRKEPRNADRRGNSFLYKRSRHCVSLEGLFRILTEQTRSTADSLYLLSQPL